ncbi:MAG: ATP synthase F1 subunit delta [Bacteroidota bacterium]
MSDMRVAKRYATALIKSAQEMNMLEEVTRDIQILKATLQNTKDFRLFLSSPIISIEKKRRVVAELFATQLHTMTFTFLNMLIEKGRENVLPSIITQFHFLYNEMLGILSVDVKTVTPFSGTQEKALVVTLEEYSGKKVLVTFSLDKSIQGGFIARAGDTVFDGSIRRQLERLRERFVRGTPERN